MLLSRYKFSSVRWTLWAHFAIWTGIEDGRTWIGHRCPYYGDSCQLCKITRSPWSYLANNDSKGNKQIFIHKLGVDETLYNREEITRCFIKKKIKKNLEGIKEKFTSFEMMCLKTKTFYFWYKIMIETFSPCDGQVVIHLGIAPGAKGITLEQTGKNHYYKDRDVSGLCPVHHCCIEGGPERLDSIIDMRSLSKHLKNMGLDVIYSRDAGR